MNNIVLFDTNHQNLKPLTYTRPVAELRIGILTIAEKWSQRLGLPVSYCTEDYLQPKFPYVSSHDQLVIASGILPDNDLLEHIGKLDMNQSLVADGSFLAARIGNGNDKLAIESFQSLSKIQYPLPYREVTHPWHLFAWNGEELKKDFELLTAGRQSMMIDDTNRVVGHQNVFIEEGALVRFSIINAETGPVYIGTGAEIMENCVVRGPFAMLPGSVLKMGAKIYGPTTIGPACKVGGEVNNCVFQGYSNKGHDGFLGNSVIGEWCNLGADTNNSNLKNNYDEVRIWNYAQDHFIKTGLQFCGLIMGDHSKCGINTMFNTGTVVGVSANIFGSGFPRNLVPSFAWGGSGGFSEFKLNKALDVVQRVYERRNKRLEQAEIDILTHIYEQTANYRRFY